MRALRSSGDAVAVGRRGREIRLGGTHQPRRRPRRGIAAVELAVLLPLLGFLLVATVDYSRLFFYSVRLTNCARNGALYGRSSAFDPLSPYASLQQAALADVADLPIQPVVTSTTGVGLGGQSYIEVKVTYPFTTFAKYPGIPSTVNLERTVRMPIAPLAPRAQ